MLRNNYPITRIVGVSITALGVMLFCIFYENLMREIRGEYFVFDREWQVLFAVLMTVLSIGIGLVLKQKWARTLFVVFLIIVTVGWLMIMISNGQFNQRDSLIFIGATIFIITFATSLILLFFNKKLNEEFDEEVIEDIDETLDSQLFQ